MNLTVAGVHAYNLENLYSRKSVEQFKLFVGFQNKVCANLCISTHGFKSDVKVSTIAELAKAEYNLLGELKLLAAKLTGNALTGIQRVQGN